MFEAPRPVAAAKQQACESNLLGATMATPPALLLCVLLLAGMPLWLIGLVAAVSPCPDALIAARLATAQATCDVADLALLQAGDSFSSASDLVCHPSLLPPPPPAVPPPQAPASCVPVRGPLCARVVLGVVIIYVLTHAHKRG